MTALAVAHPTLLPAIIGAAGAVVAAVLAACIAVLGAKLLNRANATHNLVNGRLTQALEDIQMLKNERGSQARRSTDHNTIGDTNADS